MSGRRQLHNGRFLLADDGKAAVHPDCCCGEGIEIDCDSSPSVSIWASEDIYDPGDPPPDYFPADFTQAEAFWTQAPLAYDCSLVYALCDPPFEHDVGEESPRLQYSYFASYPNAPSVIAMLTSDFTIYPSEDVHFGIMVYNDWDDSGNIWINGTKQISGWRGDWYRELDNRNCNVGGNHWYVETFAANEAIRVQLAVFDNVTIDVHWYVRMAFWYDGDPVPGGWPETFTFRIMDNQGWE